MHKFAELYLIDVSIFSVLQIIYHGDHTRKIKWILRKPNECKRIQGGPKEFWKDHVVSRWYVDHAQFQEAQLGRGFFFWKFVHISDAPTCRFKQSNFSSKSLITQVSISQDAPNSNSIHIAHNNPTGSDIKVKG